MKRKVIVCIMLWVLMILVWSNNGEPLPFSDLSFKDFVVIFIGLFIVNPIIIFLLKKLWNWFLSIPCINVLGFPF